MMQRWPAAQAGLKLGSLCTVSLRVVGASAVLPFGREVGQQAEHAVLGDQRRLTILLAFNGQPDERCHAEREHLALKQFLLRVLDPEKRHQTVCARDGQVVRAHGAILASACNG